MNLTQVTFPVHLRTGWRDFSPALHWHTTQHVTSALARLSPRIRSVDVRITDDDSGRLLCTLDASLRPSGSVSVSVRGWDSHEVVERATARARKRLQDLRDHAVGSGDRVSRIA